MGSTIFKNEVGNVYDRLTVIEVANPGAPAGTLRKWRCICKCGNYTVATGKNLRKGDTKSCGCKRQELARTANLSYRWEARNDVPATQTPEYASWRAMITRCTDENSDAWEKYGGREVRICKRWLDSFDAFVEDMGIRPSLDYSIDRINNDGNYEPGNCRWATAQEQNRNRKSNRLINCRGEVRCLKEWSEISGIGRTTIRQRLDLGWSPEDAIFKPTNRMQQ